LHEQSVPEKITLRSNGSRRKFWRSLLHPQVTSHRKIVAHAATQGDYIRIEIGWEATGLLYVPFHRFLSTSPLLCPFELELVCINPKRVANFKEVWCCDWKRVQPFSNVFGATGIALLTEFTVAELTAMSHDPLVDLSPFLCPPIELHPTPGKSFLD